MTREERLDYIKRRGGMRAHASEIYHQQVPTPKISSLNNLQKEHERLLSGHPKQCKIHGFHFRWLKRPRSLRCGLCDETSILRSKLGGAKSRRKQNFELTLELILKTLERQNNHCALTGQLFKSVRDISIDRIDSSKGYLANNIQLVTKQANVCKWSLTNEQFIDMCKQVVKFNQKRSLKELVKPAGGASQPTKNPAGTPPNSGSTLGTILGGTL